MPLPKLNDEPDDLSAPLDLFFFSLLFAFQGACWFGIGLCLGRMLWAR